MCVLSVNQRLRIKETACARERSVVMIKAALKWPVGIDRPRSRELGDVPLAGGDSRITRRLERLRDGDAVRIQIAFIPFELVALGHVADAGLMRIQDR